MTLRERAEKHVDGCPSALRPLEWCGSDTRIADLKLVIGRNDIDMVRLELQLVIAHLGDWHFRAPTDDGREFAVVVGRQMHYHHVRDPEISRHGVEEFP